MAIQDTLSAIIRAEIRTTITRIQDGGGGGDFSGLDRYDHLVAQAVQNGSGAREALGAFTAEFTIPASTSPIQLASLDPLGALGDDAPSTDPANSSLRAILFENLDDPVTGNFYTVNPATGGAALSGWIEGTGNPELQINPGGAELAIFPNGIVAWTTPGNGDTLDVEADNAPVLARLTYLFG